MKEPQKPSRKNPHIGWLVTVPLHNFGASTACVNMDLEVTEKLSWHPDTVWLRYTEDFSIH
jgi:hypothetical protein